MVKFNRKCFLNYDILVFQKAAFRRRPACNVTEMLPPSAAWTPLWKLIALHGAGGCVAVEKKKNGRKKGK